MAETQNNLALLHRKEWQTMMPAPTTTAAASFVIAGNQGKQNCALYIASNTVHYLYHHDEDDWVQIPSGALPVAIAAGACGTYNPWSLPVTANGGSTTTITVASASFNLNGFVRGQIVEFLTGTDANIGLRRTITELLTDAGTGTITLTLDSAVTTVVSGDTFRIQSGAFYVLCQGVLAAGYFRVFDLATYAWSSKTIVGANSTLAGVTWGTHGNMDSPTMSGVSYQTSTATAGSTSTTLEDTVAPFVASVLANRQVRITGGTGIGQTRHIVSNTATVLTVASAAGSISAMTRTTNVVTATVAADTPNLRIGRGITVSSASDASFNGTFRIKSVTASGAATILTWDQTAANQASAQTAVSQDVWFVTPDNTSTYVIEGCEEHIFLTGNAAVTMYQYSTLRDSWITISPGVARAAAPGLGSGQCWIGVTGDTGWATNFKDGDFMYSVRGGASTVIDRYQLSANVWLAAPGVNYPAINTFTTGTSSFWNGRYIYIAKEGSATVPQRFYKYAIRGNYLEPVTSDWYFGGAALLGEKCWVKNLSTTGTVKWMYCLQSTSTNLRRIMIF